MATPSCVFCTRRSKTRLVALMLCYCITATTAFIPTTTQIVRRPNVPSLSSVSSASIFPPGRSDRTKTLVVPTSYVSIFPSTSCRSKISVEGPTRHAYTPSLSAFSSSSSSSASPNGNKEEAFITLIKSFYFPFYVLLAGVLGAMRPQLYSRLSDVFITRALSLVMMLMGTTLTIQDFQRIGKSKPAILLGFASQFTIMPTCAYVCGRLYNLPPHLQAGLILVGCCPGGTASNLVTLLAKADVALSVTMTAVSTISAGFMTPLLTGTLLGALVPVDTSALIRTTLQVVLGPVLFGILANTYLLPRLPRAFKNRLDSITPVLSGLFVSLICGSCVASNSMAVRSVGPSLLLAVINLHVFGFLFGYIFSRILGFSRRVAKTVSIETGMQNSALATVLSAASLPHPSSGLPGAVSAVCHSIIGSILAFVWSRDKDKEGGGDEE